MKAKAAHVFKRLLVAFTLALGVMTARSASAGGYDVFFKIDKVGPNDANGPEGKAVQATGFQWTGRHVGGAQAGVPVTITKFVDDVSPNLLYAARYAPSVGNVTLWVHSTLGPQGAVLMKVTFYDVELLTVEENGDISAAQPRPTEQVVFAYGKADYWYTPLGPDGKATGKTVGPVDLKPI